MKEYKVVCVKDVDIGQGAEDVMNQYAREGWAVKAVTYWQRMGYCLVVTFERDMA